jgi:hypothetical protein
LKVTTAKATLAVAITREGEAEFSFKVLNLVDVKAGGSASKEATTTLEVDLLALEGEEGYGGIRYIVPPGMQKGFEVWTTETAPSVNRDDSIDDPSDLFGSEEQRSSGDG